MKIQEIKIPHHGRAIDATAYWPDSSAKTPAVIMSHGYGGTKLGAAPLAEMLAKSGFAAVCLTLCGGSNADPSDFPTTEMSLITERDDILAAMDWMKNCECVDPERIVLYGESQGGMASVLASAEAPDAIAGLALLFPALCIPDDWRKRFPMDADMPDTFEFWGMMLSRAYYEAARKLQVFDILPTYQGPVLIMHGEKDAIVPVTYAKQAAERYQQAELALFPEEGHGFTPQGMQKVSELLHSFVSRVTMS